MASETRITMTALDLKDEIIEGFASMVEEYAKEKHGVTFRKEPQPHHVTIHYMGELPFENVSRVIYPIYKDAAMSHAVFQFVIYLSKKVMLLGKDETKLGIPLEVSEAFKDFAADVRERVSERGIRPPDFPEFKPHVTLGEFVGVVSDEQKQDILKYLESLTSHVSEIECKGRDVKFYTKRPGEKYIVSRRMKFISNKVKKYNGFRTVVNGQVWEDPSKNCRP